MNIYLTRKMKKKYKGKRRTENIKNLEGKIKHKINIKRKKKQNDKKKRKENGKNKQQKKNWPGQLLLGRPTALWMELSLIYPQTISFGTNPPLTFFFV